MYILVGLTFDHLELTHKYNIFFIGTKVVI